jgi:hypothetical protein
LSRADDLRAARGRIVYVPKIVPDVQVEKTSGGNNNPESGTSSQQTPGLSPPQWLLPKNHQEIFDAIKGALPTSETPLRTVAELLTRAESRELLVPHRTKHVEFSRDPQYLEKLTNVVSRAPFYPHQLKLVKFGGALVWGISSTHVESALPPYPKPVQLRATIIL